MKDRVLVLGATGQDGQIVGSRLHQSGYVVLGAGGKRPRERARLWGLDTSWRLEPGDLSDTRRLRDLVQAFRPTVVMNFVGFSNVGASWLRPDLSEKMNLVFVKRLIQLLVDESEKGIPIRSVYHSSSSEIFGYAEQVPQTDSTAFRPTSPYGRHKAEAHDFLRATRDEAPFPITIGIPFNHESPLRTNDFVSMKIAQSVAKLATGQIQHFSLANLEAERDWGFAGDYAEAFTEMALSATGDDFVVATGVLRSVDDMVRSAFTSVDLEYRPGVVRVIENPRVAEPKNLVGSPEKITDQIGWISRTPFDEIVAEMVHFELSMSRSRNSKTGSLPDFPRRGIA